MKAPDKVYERNGYTVSVRQVYVEVTIHGLAYCMGFDLREPEPGDDRRLVPRYPWEAARVIAAAVAISKMRGVLPQQGLGTLLECIARDPEEFVTCADVVLEYEYFFGSNYPVEVAREGDDKALRKALTRRNG